MDDTTGVPTAESGASADIMGALNKQANMATAQYEMLAKQLNKLGENGMAAEMITPMVTPMLTGGGDGLFGGGGGGGLVGGLILGSLLRNNGNLLGGEGGSVANPAQAQANMSLMAGIGELKQAVAVSTATMETSNATQTGQLTTAILTSTSANQMAVGQLKDVINANTVALMQQLNGVDKSVMNSQYAVTQAVTNDGERTRALITSQYEATLNRQLSDANAAIIELRSDNRLNERARGIEITTTNNINQAQAQSQQQQQQQYLASLVNGLANDLQYIRSTNQAINIGAGTQTANPQNTNNNVRA